MRELERNTRPVPTTAAPRLSIVGAGRLGRALGSALRGTQVQVQVRGPLGRGASLADADVVLLCVPDAEISAAAALVPPGPMLGHCSGATGLDVLGGRSGFSLHPLMTVTADTSPELSGAAAAIAATDPAALQFARVLAGALGMRPLLVADEDRAAYHAAASIASNFLVTLEAAAERVAASAGVARADLVPLVRATVDNWAALGAERALTGPVARGDEVTVARQREAVRDQAPEVLDLFDALTIATRALVAPAAPGPVVG
ncbi:MAG: DUF2520 domain-containing protein [Solirubrobacteraceae bacterium]